MLDIAIEGGTIYDGYAGEALLGDVGIKGEKIVAVGRGLGEGKKRIDASGRIVCPGFIDIHSHSDFSAVINPNLDSKIRQGVTTELVGNCGFSACPILNEQHRADLSRKYAGSGMEITWSWPEEYFSILNRSGIALNIGILVGHGNIRTAVMGRSSASPTQNDLERMKRIADRCLREGAFGMSTGLIYSPGTFSTKEEIIEVLSAVRERGGLYATHMRNEGGRVGDAVREAVECARKAGVKLQVSHLKAAGKENWGKIEEAFEAIESATGEGLDVTCDRYPYIASSTSLDTVLPTWAYEGGDDKELARLADAQTRATMAKEILERHLNEDYWDRVIVSYVWAEELKKYEGKSLAAIAKEKGEDYCEVLFDIILRDQLRTEMVSIAMCEENLEKVLKKPYSMIGSDGAAKADYGVLSAGKPHPRTYGTFPRVIAKYVKKGVLGMGEAIAKMTSMPAKKIGLDRRGTISEGAYADIVIFDPEKVTDMATFEDPHRYPEGIEIVMVNGKVTVEKGRFLGVLNGRVLRKGIRD
ncbi:D-aminoacylase [bacterium]|nr:D-aminoacylase [bacterium]